MMDVMPRRIVTLRGRAGLLLVMVLLVFSNTTSAALFDSKIVRAARKGDIPTLRAELDKGADVNQRRGMGETLLLVAAQRGHLDAVELLLERGADPNLATVGRSTALHFAAWKGQADMASALLARGALVNVRGPGGMTPMATAAEFDHPEIIRILLDAGGDPHLRNDAGQSPLSIFRTSERRDEALLERMANTSERGEDALPWQGFGASEPLDVRQAGLEKVRQTYNCVDAGPILSMEQTGITEKVGAFPSTDVYEARIRMPCIAGAPVQTFRIDIDPIAKKVYSVRREGE